LLHETTTKYRTDRKIQAETARGYRTDPEINLLSAFHDTEIQPEEIC